MTSENNNRDGRIISGAESVQSTKSTNSTESGNTKHSPQAQSPEPINSGRRDLLKGAGLFGVAAMGSATSSNLIAAESSFPTDNNPEAREALEVLTAREAETLEEICDCLIPADENGPGARLARAVHYIDRSLASHNRGDRDHYLISLTAIDEYAVQTRGKPYHLLSRDVQNSILLGLQEGKVPGCSPSSSGFFNLVRNDTIDGTFCDPYYGGNQQFVGWDMLRYPGVRLSASEADVAQGGDLRPSHRSAYDHQTYTKLALGPDSDNDRGGSHA